MRHLAGIEWVRRGESGSCTTPRTSGQLSTAARLGSRLRFIVVALVLVDLLDGLVAEEHPRHWGRAGNGGRLAALHTRGGLSARDVERRAVRRESGVRYMERGSIARRKHPRRSVVRKTSCCVLAYGGRTLLHLGDDESG